MSSTKSSCPLKNNPVHPIQQSNPLRPSVVLTGGCYITRFETILHLKAFEKDYANFVSFIDSMEWKRKAAGLPSDFNTLGAGQQ